jgi:hypothetical protein
VKGPAFTMMAEGRPHKVVTVVPLLLIAD